MRIAYVGVKGLPAKGGAERTVEAIVRRLAGQHEIAVYCDSRYTPRGAEVPGAHLIRLPTLPGKHLRPLSLLAMSALHALFLGRYDLVHIHNVEACCVAPLLRLRFRMIATAQGLAYRRARWGTLVRALLRLNDYFYTWFPHTLTSVSLPFVKEWRRRFGREVYYVPNGVDDYPPPDGKGVKSNYILFAAGRMDPTKGGHLLIQAFGQVQTDKSLLVVGELSTVPKYGRELQRMADDRVRFVPFIHSRDKLDELVRGATFFVFPSIVEGMSLMLLEVASLGTAIVCSDIPENTNVLGEHAVYFKSGDVDDLADKLRWALANTEALRALGSAAQAWVKQNYSWDVIVERYEKLYQQTLEGVA